MNSSLSILITGSSSGFGYLMAKTLAKRGHTVFASMRDVQGKNSSRAEELRQWAAQEQHTLDVIELDVTDDASVNAAVEMVANAVPQLDVVINNAGVVTIGFSEAFSLQQAQELFDVNFFGVVRMNQAVLPLMRQQKSGLIVHISSNIGRIAMPFMGLYCASKAAVELLAETYRYELSGLGVDSVIVEPGAFPTGIFSKGAAPAAGAIFAEYGDTTTTLQNAFVALAEYLASEHAPDSQLVAEATADLIETPAGLRPLRTMIDFGGQRVQEINDVALEIQTHVLESLGLKELMSLKAPTKEL